MNEPTLNDVLIDLIQDVTTAKEFVLAELPDVINQLLVWHMWRSLILCLLGIVLIIAALLQWRYIVKDWARICRNDLDLLVILGGGTTTFLFVVLSFTSLINITWLQILMAPKIYILEYAAGLVK